MRQARTCYDHLAGRLGVGIFSSLIDAGAITGADGRHHLDHERNDRLAAFGSDIAYRLTAAGRRTLEELEVALPAGAEDGTTPLRYCVDWSEQRHHLSGRVGRARCARLFDLGWLQRHENIRAVRVTPAGTRGLKRVFGAAAVA